MMKTRLAMAIVALLALTTPTFAVEGAMFFTAFGVYVMNVYSTPEGNGTPVPYPYGVQIFDGTTPVAGIPANNIRLYIGTHGYGQPHVSYLCSQTYLLATGPTSSTGTAYFPSDALRAFGPGDYWYRCHVEVLYSGTWYKIFPESPANGFPTCKIYWKTPDLDRDSLVGLNDVALFSQMRSNGVYDPEADFNSDGVENLSDLPMLATAYGESCN